jgi:uncharacterized membrane protein YfcA
VVALAQVCHSTIPEFILTIFLLKTSAVVVSSTVVVSNILEGLVIDTGIAAVMAGMLVLGIPFGVHIAKCVPEWQLRLAVATLLVGIGVSSVVKVLPKML